MNLEDKRLASRFYADLPPVPQPNDVLSLEELSEIEDREDDDAHWD